MAACDIVPFRSRTMGEVSGGERLRILLARALAVEADILLADEPIAALDPLHQLQVMELLRMTARQGRGVVVVLHDLALAARFCDRLVCSPVVACWPKDRRLRSCATSILRPPTALRSFEENGTEFRFFCPGRLARMLAAPDLGNRV